jgi:hypothetical protein
MELMKRYVLLILVVIVGPVLEGVKSLIADTEDENAHGYHQHDHDDPDLLLGDLQSDTNYNNELGGYEDMDPNGYIAFCPCMGEKEVFN